MTPRVWNYRKNFPNGAVYIGRGSPYGNPFEIGRHGDRETCIRRFECEILPDLDVSALRGKHLVCFCDPLPCHGWPIIKKANPPAGGLKAALARLEEAVQEGVQAHTKPLSVASHSGMVNVPSPLSST